MTPAHWHEPQIDLAALAILDRDIDVTVMGEPEFDAQGLADAAGWPVEDIIDLCLWAGLPAVAGERVYTKKDLAGLLALKEYAERDNLDRAALGTLARSISYSMERLALTQVEAIVHRLATSGLSDTAARVAAAEYAPMQNDAILEQIQLLWQRHFAAAIHRLTTETILLRGVSDDDKQFPLVVGVGYAKVADFTSKAAAFDVAGYARFVQNFNNRAADIINAGGGRVVKLMGDTAVWVTPSIDAGAEIALQLATLHESGFDGQLQIGLTWCRVMSLHGDIFGPGVNLAAKLSEYAPAGEIYIDDAAASQFVRNPHFFIEAQPELDIKGLGMVRPWILSAGAGTRMTLKDEG